MTRERREPESIRRKKRRRRSPEEIEEIRRRRKIQELQNNEDEFEESKHRNTRNNRRKKKNNMSIAKKAFIITSLVLLLILVGFALMLMNFFGKIESNMALSGEAPGRNEPVNILILGMDIGDPNQASNESIKRTDSMMLFNYNPKTKSAKVVSIPRDTLVKEGNKTYKINAAYQRGGDSKVKSVVENLLSVNINYIAKIDYEGFRQFIDAIGGVNIDIERDMIYDDDGQNLHINLKKGTNQHLDGDKAEQFFRWRKNNDGSGFANGDLDRIENQHKFLNEVVKKCTSPTIVFKIPKILNVAANNIQTNMSATKMISYGIKMINIDSGNIEMTTIQGNPQMIGGESYLVFKESMNKDLLSSLHSSTKTSTKINKDNTKVLILNGTKINGLAAEVKGELSVLGWSRVDTGNGNPYNKSVIMTNDDEIENAISESLPKIKKTDKKQENDEYASYDVVIIIGSDYKKLGE